MRLERFTFGSIRIDGVTYRQDVVIDRGTIRKRRKKPSKPFRDTSVTPRCPSRRRFRGSAAGSWWVRRHGALPVMDDVRQQASHRDVELLICRRQMRSRR